MCTGCERSTLETSISFVTDSAPRDRFVSSERSRPSSFSTSKMPGLAADPGERDAQRLEDLSRRRCPFDSASARSAASIGVRPPTASSAASASRVAASVSRGASRSFHCFATASGSYSIGVAQIRRRLAHDVVDRARAHLEQIEQREYHASRAASSSSVASPAATSARVTSGASSAAGHHARGAGRSSTRASSCRRSPPSSTARRSRTARSSAARSSPRCRCPATSRAARES